MKLGRIHMEFTELADYPLPAGTLTEWIPTADGADFSPDDRPLSCIHEDHCVRASARPDAAHSNSWLGAVFEMPGPLDARALAEALRAWTVRHEALRTTVTATESGYIRTTCAPPAVRVTARAIGPLRTGTRVHQHITDFFGGGLAPTRWPHCLIVTIGDIQPPFGDGGFLLVFGADHSVMDAYSMMLAIGEIQRLYRAARTGTPAALPAVASCADYGAVERAAAEELTADHPAVHRWRGFLDHGRGFPTFPLDTVSHRRAPVRRYQSGLSTWVLTADQSEAIERRCRAAGHTVQSGVLAALAATTATLSGARTLRFAMPVHTRRDALEAHALGWYVGLVPIEIPIPAGAVFEDLLTDAAAAARIARPLARYPYPRIAGLLGSTAIPRFVVSYLDVRKIPDAARWRDWAVRPLRSGEADDDEVYFWIARSPDGVAVSARFPNNEVAAANVHRFIHTFASVLAHSAGADSHRARRREADLAPVGQVGERR
ncbi:condensation domain-containing protein [Nocardia takedensis]|uniref:condensation domain-containing protein n=1 Tax=Nocardia takedensis TaxID=259390 RepID=UPI000309AB5D|nr:condensation domain-containing protein [Nocardia takedensis]